MAIASFDAKEIDKETDYLIAGYIREIQKELPADTIFHIIPELVNYECLRFYYIPEQFVACTNNLRITNKGTRIEAETEFRQLENPKSFAIGNFKVSASSQFIYRWKFKMVKYPYWVFIGITSATNIDVDKLLFLDSKHDHYAFSNGGLKYNVKYGHQTGFDQNPDWGFDVDDYVIMELNPKENSLKYYVIRRDDKKLKCTFDDITFDGKVYRLAVSMIYKKTVVELCEFTKVLHQ